jgi:hypothetical protein
VRSLPAFAAGTRTAGASLCCGFSGALNGMFVAEEVFA